MALEKDSELPSATPVLTDAVRGLDDPGGTPISVTFLLSAIQTLFDTSTSINPPRGYMRNGKIVPSVSSDNLTVALKTLAGTDPSASDPVTVRIGDTEHKITAALSVTAAAATNWCNAGGAELATKEIDYFVYLGYNATDGVVIGFSRIPYANIYSDFSATSTNEKYCKISTITTAASTDIYENVGRFAATLSAGAGYTWTVPTYTGANLIQRPVYWTRILNWTPSWSGFTLGNGTSSGKYSIIGNNGWFSATLTFGSTTSISGNPYVTPLPMAEVSGMYLFPNSVFLRDTGTAGYVGSLVSFHTSDAKEIQVRKTDATYETNLVITSTIPFTWTTSDQIVVEWGSYLLA